MKTVHLLAAVTLALELLPSPAGATGQRGELWETHLTIQGAQHGEMAMPAQRICQLPATRDPKAMLPQMSEDCPGVAVRQTGDRVSWSGQCKQGRSEGEMRFIGSDRIEGRMTMATTQGPFAMSIRARKLGACTLAAP